MIDEKVIKKRVNELWDGIKYLSASKTMNYETVIALTIVKINTMMELVGKKDIFTKAEIDNIQISNVEKFFVKELPNKKDKYNPNTQTLRPQERIWENTTKSRRKWND